MKKLLLLLVGALVALAAHANLYIVGQNYGTTDPENPVVVTAESDGCYYFQAKEGWFKISSAKGKWDTFNNSVLVAKNDWANDGNLEKASLEKQNNNFNDVNFNSDYTYYKVSADFSTIWRSKSEITSGSQGGGYKLKGDFTDNWKLVDLPYEHTFDGSQGAQRFGLQDNGGTYYSYDQVFNGTTINWTINGKDGEFSIAANYRGTVKFSVTGNVFTIEAVGGGDNPTHVYELWTNWQNNGTFRGFALNEANGYSYTLNFSGTESGIGAGLHYDGAWRGADNTSAYNGTTKTYNMSLTNGGDITFATGLKGAVKFVLDVTNMTLTVSGGEIEVVPATDNYIYFYDVTNTLSNVWVYGYWNGGNSGFQQMERVKNDDGDNLYVKVNGNYYPVWKHDFGSDIPTNLIFLKGKDWGDYNANKILTAEPVYTARNFYYVNGTTYGKSATRELAVKPVEPFEVYLIGEGFGGWDTGAKLTPNENYTEFTRTFSSIEKKTEGFKVREIHHGSQTDYSTRNLQMVANTLYTMEESTGPGNNSNVSATINESVKVIYKIEDDVHTIYLETVQVEEEYPKAFYLIGQSFGAWNKPGAFPLSLVDDLSTETTKVYSRYIEIMPTTEWKILEVDADMVTNTDRHNEYSVEGATAAQPKVLDYDTVYDLIEEDHGGLNVKVAESYTYGVTLYVTYDIVNNKRTVELRQRDPWEGYPECYYLRGTILGGWAQQEYVYYGKVDGVDYFGARYDYADIKRYTSPTDYALITGIDRDDSDWIWHAFFFNEDGDLYTTIKYNQSTGWAMGYQELLDANKSYTALTQFSNSSTLTPGSSVRVTASNGDSGNSFSGFTNGKTYLFKLQNTDKKDVTVEVVEYTDDLKAKYPEVIGTPYNGKWNDTNSRGEELTVKMVRSDVPGVYEYDFTQGKFYDLQYYNEYGEPERFHFNVSHKDGDQFWDANAHTAVDDPNIDMYYSTTTPFINGSSMGKNFLLQGPCVLKFRHDADSDDPNGEMWVEHVAEDTQLTARFSFWDKGDEAYTGHSNLNWWKNAEARNMKVVLYTRDSDGNLIEGAQQVLIGNADTEVQNYVSGTQTKNGKVYYYRRAIKENLLKDADGNDIVTYTNGQPVGLWVRIYKAGDESTYLDRPYALNAQYTQNTTVDGEDECYNVYPDKFKPGNPHIDFVPGIEVIEAKNVRVNNTRHLGGMTTEQEVEYPYLNEFMIDIIFNTHGKDYFPFNPGKQGDAYTVDRDSTDDHPAVDEDGNEIKDADGNPVMVIHDIYKLDDPANCIWTKTNTLTLIYKGNAAAQLTKRPTDEDYTGYRTLRGFTPRECKATDNITATVRYQSAGMTFSRSQSRRFKSMADQYLPKLSSQNIYDNEDDVVVYPFYGYNKTSQGGDMGVDVLDVIVVNQHIIDTDDDEVYRQLGIPTTTGEGVDGKRRLFAAYMGYQATITRSELNNKIHDLDQQFLNAYHWGTPVTTGTKLDQFLPVVEEQYNVTLPRHEANTWHMLTHPITTDDHEADPHVINNTLALHLHHLYCQNRGITPADKKIAFTENNPIDIHVDYYVYLPVTADVHFGYTSTDREPDPQPTDPQAAAKRAAKAKAKAMAKAGRAMTRRVVARADGLTPSNSFTSGTPDKPYYDMFSVDKSVVPSELVTDETVAGVANVAADDANAPVEYFNLEGYRVSGDNLAPGIYIRRQGTKVDKILVK